MARLRRKQAETSPGKAGIGHAIKKASKDSAKKVVDDKKLKNIGKILLNDRKVLGELPNGQNRRNSRRIVKSEVQENNNKFEQINENVVMEEDVKDEDPEMAGLCEYEKIRLQNIRERQAMFSMLDIQDAKQGISELTSPPKKNVPSQRGLASERKVKEVLPPRKSARIAGGQVAEIQRFVPLVETPDEDERMPDLKHLQLQESLKDNEEMKVATATSLVSTLASTTLNKKTTIVTSAKSLSSLSLTEERVAKVVPARIFSMAIHSGDRLVAAAGGKWGEVGLWNVEDTESVGHGVHLFQPHVRPVNCLTWDLANLNNLVSTSYDGTMRVLDTEKLEYSLLYGEEKFLMSGGWTSTHVQVDHNTFIVSQGKAGSGALVDRRVTWEKPVSVYKMCDRVHVRSLSLHPTNPHHLLAGNTRGGCYVFDLRESTTGLLTPVTTLLGHTKAISSSQFSVTGDQVVTLASDDKIRLYDTSSLPKSLPAQCQVRHNNQTGRWLTPFRVCWHPSQSDLLVTGSMEQPRQIEMWSTKGGNLQMAGRLRSDYLGSVNSLMAIHPSRQVVVGGNSSGRVHCFL